MRPYLVNISECGYIRLGILKCLWTTLFFSNGQPFTQSIPYLKRSCISKMHWISVIPVPLRAKGFKRICGKDHRSVCRVNIHTAADSIQANTAVWVHHCEQSESPSARTANTANISHMECYDRDYSTDLFTLRQREPLIQNFKSSHGSSKQQGVKPYPEWPGVPETEAKPWRQLLQMRPSWQWSLFKKKQTNKHRRLRLEKCYLRKITFYIYKTNQAQAVFQEDLLCHLKKKKKTQFLQNRNSMQQCSFGIEQLLGLNTLFQKETLYSDLYSNSFYILFDILLNEGGLSTLG